MKRAALAGLGALLLGAGTARATAPGTFGYGARSAGLALSDVADPTPTGAPQANAAGAASPGLRLALGYGYGDLALALDGRDAGVHDVSGVEIAAQYGAALTGDFTAGLSLAMRFPDESIVRIAFRPATEPQFVRYETPLARTTVDLVLALRWQAERTGPAVALGGGVAGSLDLGGKGTDFVLGQDGSGTYADAATDVELPYHFAPILGAQVDLGRAALGATFRGALSVDLSLEAKNRIALADNPLNGTTDVSVFGASGYDPPTIDVGGRIAIAGGLSAFGALQYAMFRFAPPPVADVRIDVRLGTSPSQREARFVEPRFRDTLSPRIGLELVRPAADDASRAPKDPSRPDAAWSWALRAGYLLQPSPVPPQTGFTSYADATRHVASLGGGYRFGEAAGVDLSAQAAAQLHLLATRTEDKPDPSLPHAHYEASGHILFGALTLEGAFR